MLARTVFQADFIQSVYVRRSAATGEATFPYTDIDFDITITPATGVNLERLRRRGLLAKILFPLTGQCFVLEPSDPEDLSRTDPYRASIHNRCFYHARGIPPPWPWPTIGQMEAARRVVFWLQSYFFQAVRQANRRNQRKFYLEMGNAVGLLEHKWAEPRIWLREVERAYPVPSGQLFPAALDLAGRAAKCVGRAPPVITEVHDLPGLTILPGPSSA